ncbi:MAG: efflux RND transporter periplasmic adaptor subunit [Thermoguttaceae bacterium]
MLIFLTGIGGGGFAAWKRLAAVVHSDPPQQVSVRREMFIHEILERGSADSASNVEIRCQVESAGGLTILSVIPEGTVVEQGDLLVELDSSTLRENVTKQQITVETSRASVAQAEADLDTARLTLQEYLEGKFLQEEKTIQNEIFAADENVRSLKDTMKHSGLLFERGYITDTKLDAERIELEKAINALEIAQVKLMVLQQYTKKKSVVQYEAAIKTAEAKFESTKKNFQLESDRLAHLEKQLGLCQIRAPQDGQVVYYMPRWGGEEDIIKEGKKVFERQILLRLPDPSQMQVKGLVNEANIRLVKVGQTASIRLEAFPNQVFAGAVKIVNDYPEPGNYMGGSMSKEYMTTITILDAPDGIKPGLTAEAKIVVNRIADALVLPVQAVFEYGRQTYAITYKEGKWSKVEIKTGPTNDKQVVILSGLTEGEQVVLGAWGHRDKIDLPKLTPEEEKKIQEEKEAAAAAERPKDEKPKSEKSKQDKPKPEKVEPDTTTSEKSTTSYSAIESMQNFC